VRPAFLTLNAGSSSLKFAVFTDSDDGLACVLRGRYRVAPNGLLRSVEHRSPLLGDADATPQSLALPLEQAAAHLVDWLPAILGAGLVELVGVGHRLVHGGEQLCAPVRIDAEVMDQLQALVALAPLHLPSGLAAIRSLAAAQPSLPQVGCFDTAFHSTQARVNRLYGLPKAYAARGYLRYGFHGLACQSVMRQLAAESTKDAAGRVLIAHLGSGASLTSVREGRSVHSSMGWSALDGLVMATRSGGLDPGLVLALVREHGSVDAVESLLYRESGLQGLSGQSADFSSLLVAENDDAAVAVEVYLRRIALEAGAAIAAMGGLDTIVFSGGVGENAPLVRERVCAGLAWLDVVIDQAANGAGLGCLNTSDSRVAIRRVVVDEELEIALGMRTAGLALG
jgi:acetate kinase